MPITDPDVQQSMSQAHPGANDPRPRSERVQNWQTRENDLLEERIRQRSLNGRVHGDWADPEPRLMAWLPIPPPAMEDPRNKHRGRPRPTERILSQDMVIVPFWDSEDGDIWDRVTLGPYTFAGTARIEGQGPRLKVDKRTKKGAVTTKLISNGYDTTELQIILRVWTEEHLRDFEALMDDIQPKRTGKPFALEVYHPALALARIKYVLVYGVGFLEMTGTHGLYECKLSCFEFVETTETQKNATQTVRQRPQQEVPLDTVYITVNDNPASLPTPSSTAANP